MSDDDRVGYGRPPRKHQFKKGQSGNPKGRPKGSKNVCTIWRAEFLEPTITIKENGKSKKVCKYEMVLKVLGAEAAKGKIGAARLILEQAPAHLGTDVSTAPGSAPEDDEIIRLYLRRSRGEPEKGGGGG